MNTLPSHSVPQIPTPAPVPVWLPSGYFHPVMVGSGGEGEVWRARAFSGPSPVAIKRYRCEARRSFYREIAVLLEIENPHLVKAYNVLDAPTGDKLLVMEHCAGGTLRDVLASEGPLPPARALTLGLHVARALEALHARRCIHADVKPENIFRRRKTGSAVWKLGDLGISRRDDDGQGRRGGFTPAYVAPEQREGKAVTASDIYSLGLVLHEALTGRRPRTSTPSFRALQLAPELGEFITSCLSPDPHRRPAASPAARFLAAALSHHRASAYLTACYSQVMASRIETFWKDESHGR